MLTIAYMTNRREPCIQWFFDSFHRQCGGNYDDIKMVVIDFFADYPGRRESITKLAKTPLTHIPPKPTVWQGQYRLTQRDYFAASNARNTALCVAPDGYIVYVDDLSVLCDGWLTEVRAAVAGSYIACGSFEKVLSLEVVDGQIAGYREHPPGKDSRLKHIFTDNPVACDGGWMFGASCAIPVEALLKINGWDEDCDSMSGEDYICGIMLAKNGYDLRYCPRMKTLESEERHFMEEAFLRIIKPSKTAKDASHQMLNMVLKGGRTTAPNYSNMRELRQSVLFDNKPFPVSLIPEHHWVDGQPIREM